MVSNHRLAVSFDESKLDRVFTDLNQCHLPGVAVGIALDGKPLYRKGFGLANMELPVALSTGIRMRIGSTTKHFTALAFMLLCERAKAKIDAPLRNYLPELHPLTHTVTPRQLMTNTSGLRDANDIRFQFSGTTGRPTTRTDLVSCYRDFDDVNAAPGSAWIYNNGGWVLLTAIIERLTDAPFEQAMQELLFAPLGMHNTLVRTWDHDFVPNSATPHTHNREGRVQRLFWDQDYAGAGAIASTVDDMLSWAANMDRHQVGSDATWEAMTTPHVLPNGTSTGYGLGLILSRYRGVDVIHHPGGFTGCNAQLLKVPAAGLDVVILANRDDASATSLAYQVLDVVLPDLLPVTDANESLVTGDFRSPSSGRVIQLFEREGKQIVATEGLELPYVPGPGGGLWPVAESVHFRRPVSLLGDRHAPATLRFSDFGRPDELFPFQRTQNPADGAADIVGRYVSKSTGTQIRIESGDGGPILRSDGRFGSTHSTLKCLTHGVWRADTTGMVQPAWAILSFDRPRGGFSFTNFTTRALPFERT